ncbi:hypothetical protein [Deinococcus radiopugnans]|uniref:hypothetical protein n=1 Tax=Deinococcus radiopugnans TaxID=57497 RepID=UPI00146FED8E|nr:hypothetical protein [Deinococcus radiopugnans]
MSATAALTPQTPRSGAMLSKGHIKSTLKNAVPSGENMGSSIAKKNWRETVAGVPKVITFIWISEIGSELDFTELHM